MDEKSGTMPPIVLLGGGHAHVEVVRLLGKAGLGAQVKLVSPSRQTPYSGMLPGYISGEYGFDDFHIDLATLCARSGVEFVESAAVGIDVDRRFVLLGCGERLRYGLLSINIGSTPAVPQGLSVGLCVKPIASFTDRLAQLDALVAGGQVSKLAVVGQGVAGIEVAFALKRRFKGRSVSISLVGRAAKAAPERSWRAQQMLERELRNAEISHTPHFDVLAVEDGQLIARDERRLAVDEVIWTTSSGAPAFLRDTGLLLDPEGFIRVDRTLRSLSHPDVFAAGDVASLPEPRPKAGVFAVKEGPILAGNIQRFLSQQRMKSYRPQSSWLVLVSLADGRAIADKWGFAVLGSWVARWKHRVDSRFMRKYR